MWGLLCNSLCASRRRRCRGLTGAVGVMTALKGEWGRRPTRTSRDKLSRTWTGWGGTYGTYVFFKIFRWYYSYVSLKVWVYVPVCMKTGRERVILLWESWREVSWNPGYCRSCRQPGHDIRRLRRLLVPDRTWLRVVCSNLSSSNSGVLEGLGLWAW